MKTKKLIELLQAEDPDGDTECCIGNADISCVYKDPAYWDGKLQVLIRDENNRIVGAKYTGRGAKIVIRSLSIHDAIFDNIDLPIDYSEVGNSSRYKEADEKARQSAKNIRNEIERDYFVRFVKRQGSTITSNYIEDLEERAKEFYDKNLNYDRPLPSKYTVFYDKPLSYVEQREVQWKREIFVQYNDGDWQVSFKNSNTWPQKIKKFWHDLFSSK